MNNLLSVFWEAFSAISSCLCAVIAILISVFTFWYSNRRKIKIHIQKTMTITQVSKAKILQSKEAFFNNLKAAPIYNIEIRNVGNMPVSVIDCGIIYAPDKTSYSYENFSYGKIITFPIKVDAKDLINFSISREEILQIVTECKNLQVVFYCRTSTEYIKKVIDLQIPNSLNIKEICFTK